MQQRISTDKEFAASFENMQTKLKEELDAKREVSNRFVLSCIL